MLVGATSVARKYILVYTPSFGITAGTAAIPRLSGNTPTIVSAPLFSSLISSQKRLKKEFILSSILT
jgi:hypothetical protein